MKNLMINKRLAWTGVIIAVILLTIGLSYAYFTANITGAEEGETITVAGGSMKIIYDGGANITAENIFPSNDKFATKTFTVTGNNTTDLNMEYDLILVITNNEFTDNAIKYKLISENIDGNGEVAQSITAMKGILNDVNIYDLGSGKFIGNTNGNKVHSYSLELYFPNTDYNQNVDQGKTIEGHIEIKNHESGALISAVLNGKLATQVPASEDFEINSTSCRNINDDIIEDAKAIWNGSNWVIETNEEDTDRLICVINFVNSLAVNLPIDLEAGMIPVAFDSVGQTIKADRTNRDGNWYDYRKYKWANAVLVSSEKRDLYLSMEAGSVIFEADILAYYVWIPRYSYTLFNVNNDGNEYSNHQLINVTLQTKEDPVYNGNTNNEELTHPAFWWDKNDNYIREEGEEINGFWVGKFELTGDDVNPTIKPNLVAYKNKQLSFFWKVIEKFKSMEEYGISGSSLDSHMIKNMEWGAIAYLSNSKYGNYHNPDTNVNFYINPSSSMTTGRSGMNPDQGSTSDISNVSAGTLYGWNGKSCVTKSLGECTGEIQGIYGPSASTTGTIYGVYDMSGGTSESVMGNSAFSLSSYTNKTMNVVSAGTAFGQYTNTTLPKRYYDFYEYGTSFNDASAYKRGKLGDATKEVLMADTLSWFNNKAYFIVKDYPWISRGGYYGDGQIGGIWNFNRSAGGGGEFSSSRAVLLTP